METAIERGSKNIAKTKFQFLFNPPSRVRMIATPQFSEVAGKHGCSEAKEDAVKSITGIANLHESQQVTDDDKEMMMIGVESNPAPSSDSIVWSDSSEEVETLTMEAAVKQESVVVPKISIQLLLDPPSKVQVIKLTSLKMFSTTMRKCREI